MSSVSPSQSASNASFRVAEEAQSRLELFQKLVSMTENPPSWAIASVSALNSYLSTVQAGFASLNCSGSDGSELSSSVESSGGSVSGGVVSSVSVGSSRSSRSRRKRAKAFGEGKCYLRLVEPKFRASASEMCGSFPALARVLALPSHFLMSQASLMALRAKCDSGMVHVCAGGDFSVAEVLVAAAAKVRMGVGTVQAAVAAWGMVSSCTAVASDAIGGLERRWWNRQYSGTAVAIDLKGLAADENVDLGQVKSLLRDLPSGFLGVVVSLGKIIVTSPRHLEKTRCFESVFLSLDSVGFNFLGEFEGMPYFRLRECIVRHAVTATPDVELARAAAEGAAAGGSGMLCPVDLPTAVWPGAFSYVRVLASVTGATFLWLGDDGMALRVPDGCYLKFGQTGVVHSGESATLSSGSVVVLYWEGHDFLSVKEVGLLLLTQPYVLE